MRRLLTHSATLPLAGAAIAALVIAGCGGDDGSGLATLVTEAPTTQAASQEQAAATTTPAEGPDVSSDSQSADEVEPTGGTGIASDSSDASTGGDSDLPDDDTAAEPTPGVTEADLSDMTDEELLLEYAQCMRDNGVEFEDPTVAVDGSIMFGFRPGRGEADQAESIDRILRDPDMPAAREACGEIMESLSVPLGREALDLTEIQDDMLAFSQCMRDNGIDMPDPDFSSFGPGPGNRDGGGTVIEMEAQGVSESEFEAAIEVCQEDFGLPGPRGGRP